jgi:membrane-associated phospholipid phosphatase
MKSKVQLSRKVSEKTFSLPTLKDEFIKTGAIRSDELDIEFARPVVGSPTYCPASMWEQYFVPVLINKNLGQYKYDNSIFDTEEVLKRFVPPSPELPTADEFSLTQTLANLRGLRFGEIVAQKGIGFESALLDSFLPLGFTSEREKSRELISRVAETTEVVSLVSKAVINRARPYQYWRYDAVKPLFHPGHPSYPSGHATRAFVYYELFTLIFAGRHPVKLAAVRSGAQRVAENREIAGVHYRSDSIAGAVLAQNIVSSLNSGQIASKEFGTLLKAAQAEWPASQP